MVSVILMTSKPFVLSVVKGKSKWFRIDGTRGMAGINRCSIIAESMVYSISEPGNLNGAYHII